jgi:hypothetical protein
MTKKTNEEIWKEPTIYMKLFWTYIHKRTQCVDQLKKRADQGGKRKQHPWRWNKTWWFISCCCHWILVLYCNTFLLLTDNCKLRCFSTQKKKSATTHKKTNNPVQIVGSSSQRFLQSFDAYVSESNMWYLLPTLVLDKTSQTSSK